MCNSLWIDSNPLSLEDLDCTIKANLHEDVMVLKEQLVEANANFERLSTVANKVRDDLLERGEVSYDGTRVVNLSSTVWNKFCDVLIESPTQPPTLQDVWYLLKLHSPEYWENKPYPDLDTARKELSRYMSRYQAVGSNSVKEEE
jgi:hypothetical protein